VGGARLVQIMDPGQGRADFDLIAIPEHDAAPPSGSNILSILGAPHRVTPRRLAAEADLWRDRLARFAAPRIAVIVGGSTKNRTFTAAMAQSLMQQAAGLAAELGGSLLVTTSRRTGPEALTALEAFLPADSFLFRWEKGAANPYPALLALVDAIVVTGDSVSMCSEACAAPVPVYVFAPDGLVAPKHARLHQALYRAGYARPFDGRHETWTHPPLNAADQVAGAVRARVLAS
jgi:mitochondrial fission protein ELM1